MIVAIIPARGGSKRIPRKNIKPFLGRPVIEYAIEALKESGLFEHILVTTDDPEIAEIACAAGTAAPILRPPELSDDSATTDAVLVHALEAAKSRFGSIDHGCAVYPVNPLLDTAELRRGFDLMVERDALSVFPVVRYDFPIEQALVLEDGRPRFRWPEQMDVGSQHLPVHYHDAGMFYWFQVERFLAGGALFVPDSAAFEIDPARCQDVNSLEDWTLAELKYLRLREASE